MRQNENSRRGNYIRQLTHLFQQQNHPIRASCQRLIITTVRPQKQPTQCSFLPFSILCCVSCFHQRHKMKVLICNNKVPNEKHLVKYNLLVLVAGSCLHITRRITHWNKNIIAETKHLLFQFIVDVVFSWLKMKTWGLFHGKSWMQLEGETVSCLPKM